MNTWPENGDNIKIEQIAHINEDNTEEDNSNEEHDRPSILQ